MRKLKHKILDAQLAETIVVLTDLRTRNRAICDRANSDVDEALHARNYDGDGRGGQELTGPEEYADANFPHDDKPATGNHDVTLERMTQYAGLIDTMRDTAHDARRIGEKLITSIDERDRQAQAAVAAAHGTAGIGHCENCNHYCDGTDDDRLRRGRCDPCRQYLRRHDRERPRQLWGTDIDA